MEQIGWRAWYANGRVYHSATTPADSLPGVGLQIVVVYLKPPYREVVYGSEFIYFLRGRWAAVPTLSDIPVGALVFPGSLIPDWKFDRLQRAAFDAMDP